MHTQGHAASHVSVMGSNSQLDMHGFRLRPQARFAAVKRHRGLGVQIFTGGCMWCVDASFSKLQTGIHQPPAPSSEICTHVICGPRSHACMKLAAVADKISPHTRLLPMCM